MNLISFLDFFFNHALPVLAPALTISGFVLLAFGLWLLKNAHSRG